MLNLKTGKQFDGKSAREQLTRRDFGRGLAAIIGAGVAPSIALGLAGSANAGVGGAASGMMRNVGARLAEHFGKPNAKDYTQVGLISMFDGIENVGYGVHDSNSNTWTDLTGRAEIGDLTLTRSLFSENSLFCPKSRRGFAVNNHRINIYGISGFTISACFHVISDDSGLSGNDSYLIGFGCTKVQWGGNRLPFYLARNMIFALPSTNRESTQLANTFPFTYGDGTKASVTVSYSNSTGNLSVYANGRLIGTKDAGVDKLSFELSDAPFCLGSYQSGFFGFNGEIYNTRVYFRELTDREIAHDYKIDQTRFGV